MCTTNYLERRTLNESPYEKVGKLTSLSIAGFRDDALNESPYEKVGKCGCGGSEARTGSPSMKVPTKK